MRNLSRQEYALMSELALQGRKIVTPAEAMAILGTPRENGHHILSRLHEKGWLARIERGRYLVVLMVAPHRQCRAGATPPWPGGGLMDRAHPVLIQRHHFPLPAKLTTVGRTYDRAALLRQLAEAEATWESDLGPLVAQLPDFGQVTDELRAWLKELPPHMTVLFHGN